MKAVLCRTHGLPDTLELADLPTPEPGPGQVLIAVKAAGVNFPDTLIIQNKYQFKPPLPFSPGGELAGTITAVGADVKDFTVGQDVIAFTGWGAFAEEVVADAIKLIPIPPGVPFEIAASFVMTYGTSYHAVKARPPRPCNPVRRCWCSVPRAASGSPRTRSARRSAAG